MLAIPRTNTPHELHVRLPNLFRRKSRPRGALGYVDDLPRSRLAVVVWWLIYDQRYCLIVCVVQLLLLSRVHAATQC